MAKSMGESTAKGIGDMHEECARSPVPTETCMDLFNNQIGISIGLHHSGTCASNCLSMLQGDGLQTTPGCPGGPDRSRTPGVPPGPPYNGEPVYTDIH